jgi:hypothetical protein
MEGFRLLIDAGGSFVFVNLSEGFLAPSQPRFPVALRTFLRFTQRRRMSLQPYHTLIFLPTALPSFVPSGITTYDTAPNPTLCIITLDTDTALSGLMQLPPWKVAGFRISFLLSASAQAPLRTRSTTPHSPDYPLQYPTSNRIVRFARSPRGVVLLRVSKYCTIQRKIKCKLR